jgi:hypothetical protein|tara:strand:+ start:974 stop:1198 length:225 start_codon:yes stop_codon:yes gene_type:complete
MQVNVFISETKGQGPPALLVMPYSPMVAIPRHLQGMPWRHLAITAADDKLLGAPAAQIEAAISEAGYALVQPAG